MRAAITIEDATVQYIAHLRAKDLAANTVKNSTQVLTAAAKSWGNIHVQSIKAVHVDRLFQDNHWAPSTRNLYLGALRQFLAWARNHGYMAKDYDPTFGWRNSKVSRAPRLRLPVEEFYPLMDTAVHPRDRIALALGLFTFVRASELTTIRINDVDLKNMTLDIYRVKTKDYDTLPICEELRVELVRWMNWYRQEQGTLVGSWFLVPSKKPDEWTWSPETGRLCRVEKLAGLRPEQKIGHPYEIPQRALYALGYDISEDREGFHTLRRSGARALFDSLRSVQGTDALLRVASMLGHRDTKVTAHYIGLEQERDARNSSLAGVPMFPGLTHENGLRVVSSE